jgi:hypothetical protein
MLDGHLGDDSCSSRRESVPHHLCFFFCDATPAVFEPEVLMIRLL